MLFSLGLNLKKPHLVMVLFYNAEAILIESQIGQRKKMNKEVNCKTWSGGRSQAYMRLGVAM